MSDPLRQLVTMSRTLGNPSDDLVILGEGNTSVRATDDTFWVKASGTQLAQAAADTFVRVKYRPILDALRQESMADDTIKQLLKDATVEGQRAPSIETFLHAMCLQLQDVHFVGHTHPTAAVGLLSAENCRDFFSGCLFPDQIVLLGTSFAIVPYADPGLPLAHAVQSELDRFLDQEGRPPRVILMENHGVIALGSTPQQVINITQMLVKVCRITTTALAAGGPRFLSPAQVQRIEKRPDELTRRADLR
jgi:rhamnose utilization protein RhaD (predicted bifunctional aldolase and dehydrogenase)